MQRRKQVIAAEREKIAGRDDERLVVAHRGSVRVLEGDVKSAALARRADPDAGDRRQSVTIVDEARLERARKLGAGELEPGELVVEGHDVVQLSESELPLRELIAHAAGVADADLAAGHRLARDVG